MSNDDDFIGQLEDYLETFDGVTPLPDRVRDAVRAELPSARQVRPRPGLGRLSTMLSNAPAARFGLAAAAVVVALVLGAAFLNNRGSEGVGGPAPTPTPTPAATVAPSLAASAATPPPMLANARYVACGATDPGKDCLEPGTYQLTGAPGTWPMRVTLDVPAGWFEWGGGPAWDAVLIGQSNNGSGWGAMFYTVADVARDPCDPSKGSIPASQVDTPQKLAAAMVAWPHFTATTPEPISVDGHNGVKFVLNGTDKATCTSVGVAGHSTAGASVDAYPMVNDGGTHEPATVEIVDTGNGLLVIRATDFPQTTAFEVSGGRSPDPTGHAGDLADLHAILDSIRLTAPSSP